MGVGSAIAHGRRLRRRIGIVARSDRPGLALIRRVAWRLRVAQAARGVRFADDVRDPTTLLNVSAMSFGALSSNAILALNGGARLGGFAHDTGEGGLTKYHLQNGGDLIWEIGSGYFGARIKDGRFDPQMFREKAAHENVKCVSVKLSQGAKPGIGGVLPGQRLLSGGRQRHTADRRPDDRPQRARKHRPARPHPDRRRRQGRDRRGHRQAPRTGRRLHELGARDDDGRRLHPDAALPHAHLPGRRHDAGPAPRASAERARKSVRVQRFQQGTVAQAQQLMGSMGLHGPAELQPWMLMRRVERVATSSYADLYEWLEPGELLDAPPESWAADWRRADPDSFKARRTREDARHADRR